MASSRSKPSAPCAKIQKAFSVGIHRLMAGRDDRRMRRACRRLSKHRFRLVLADYPA
jgi:hypothetical protein